MLCPSLLLKVNNFEKEQARKHATSDSTVLLIMITNPFQMFPQVLCECAIQVSSFVLMYGTLLSPLVSLNLQ